MSKTTAEILLRALKADGRPLYQVSRAAGLPYPTVHHFWTGKRGLSLESAEKLARALGLELRPRKGK